jgi:hypothetical protein
MILLGLVIFTIILGVILLKFYHNPLILYNMAKIVQYTITNSAEFINIDGVTGTSVAGTSFSLRKSNINKFTKDATQGNVGIVMVDDTNYNFLYTNLIDPSTGLPYTSLDECEAALEGFASYTGGSGVEASYADGDIQYLSAIGDFVATPVPGTNTITIVGLPFAFDVTNIVAGYIKKIDVLNKVTDLPLTTVQAAAGIITLTDVPNFLAGDVVSVMIVGPKKAYNTSLESTKVVVQNPEWSHTTTGVLLGSGANLGILTRVATNDNPGDTFRYAGGGLLLDNISFPTFDGTYYGGKVHNLTAASSGQISAITDTSIVAFLDGTGIWTAGDEALIAEVRRYEITMDTYRTLSIQAKLNTGPNTRLNLIIMGSNHPLASVTSDEYWSNISTKFDQLGIADIYTSENELKTIILCNTVPIAVDKIMLRVDGYSMISANTVDSSYEFYVKKSY